MSLNLDQLLRGYQLHEILVEVAVIWLFVYLMIRFLRGTRGAGVIKGVAVLLVVVTLLIRVLSQGSAAFTQLNFIYDKFLGILTIVLIVVFQPELRQAMIRVGQTRWFGGATSKYGPVVDAVADAVDLLSKSQFGAVIAIERTVKLGGLIAGGEEIDAKVSSRLLSTIFWPNSPLHDLGVVIRGDRIIAANVQFPLAEDTALPGSFGSRHRAALGLTLESDCVVVVVSEETGRISIAQHGRLTPDIPRKLFREDLASRLKSDLEEANTDDSPSTSSDSTDTGFVATPHLTDEGDAEPTSAQPSQSARASTPIRLRANELENDDEQSKDDDHTRDADHDERTTVAKEAS